MADKSNWVKHGRQAVGYLTQPIDQNLTSSVIGGINLSCSPFSQKMAPTLVNIRDGVYLGGNATIGGGEPIGLDTWVAGTDLAS
ncbi:MAG: hypothetical protein F6K04_20000 [Leptolyngbya sp. SIO4C5]|uniref:hypothetical protein n=1 Tax=Sphaerothrix gracilis TaxID=3151835 RepID=UPI0013C208BF|nr:hypothetical protein [Leptolyngbya sp. SIO4C5]